MSKPEVAATMRNQLLNYASSLKKTPQLLHQRVFLTKTFDQMVQSAQFTSKNPMKRTLGPMTLTLLCIGHVSAPTLPLRTQKYGISKDIDTSRPEFIMTTSHTSHFATKQFPGLLGVRFAGNSNIANPFCKSITFPADDWRQVPAE